MTYHLLMFIQKIEKALEMPKRRIFFGQEHIKIILNLLKRKNSKDIIERALSVIIDYRFSINENYIKNKKIISIIDKFIEGKNKKPTFKKVIYKNTEYEKFLRLCLKRKTVRNFKNEKIEDDTLIKVVNCARTFPSACNRGGIYLLNTESEEVKRKILKIQLGNNGILVPNLIAIVSVELPRPKGQGFLLH